MALLAEIHGLIADMLSESSLPMHVVSGLKSISQLLPLTTHSMSSIPNFFNGPLVPLVEMLDKSNGKDNLFSTKSQLNVFHRNMANSGDFVKLTNGSLTHKENGFSFKLKSYSSISLIRAPSPSKRPLRLQKTVFNFYSRDDSEKNKKENDLNEEKSLQLIKLEDGTRFDLNFMTEHSEYWNDIEKWDFPIFNANSVSNNCILSQMCYGIFLQVDYLKTFNIPTLEFLNYFRALESGYRNIPYHNRTHAADVTHGVYYLTTQSIPGANDTQPLSAHFPALELMALYTAAAMHDCDHPGRSNAFLVKTHAPQALLYNDKSVLENHHAATAWSLLYSKSNYNFLKCLNEADFKWFRFLVIELILATDLEKHFEILNEFKSKLCENEGHKLDWQNEKDRLLMMKICIKIADVNGPCKERSLHFKWTERIVEEFYEQGDEEARLGLPISLFMDRKSPQLAKCQDGFIKFIVGPLCNAYDKSGLLPGQWSETTNAKADANSKLGNQLKRERECPLAKNLKDNHEYWTMLLEQEVKDKQT